MNLFKKFTTIEEAKSIKVVINQEGFKNLKSVFDNKEKNLIQDKKVNVKKHKFDEDKIIDYINSDILITEIERPFSIKLLQIDLIQKNIILNENKSNHMLKIKVI